MNVLPCLMLGVFSCLSAEDSNMVQALKDKYPYTIYQDVLIKEDVVISGTQICEPRYQMIRPVLETFQKPFKMLEIGAAQGFFSFSILRDYPLASSVMIENNTCFYSHHGDLLEDLCKLNDPYNSRLIFLKHTVTLADFDYLNQHEHFDLVLAFLVIHQISNDLKEQIQILKSLLALGDNLILEVSDDAAFMFTRHCKTLAQKMNATYLGQIKRYKDPERTETGHFFWFKNKDSHLSNTQNRILHNETFKYLHRVYP